MLDQNSNVTRLEEGPQVFVRRDHEKVVQEKRKHIIIPPRHYCVIENPVLRNEVSFRLVGSHSQSDNRLHGIMNLKYWVYFWL